MQTHLLARSKGEVGSKEINTGRVPVSAAFRRKRSAEVFGVER